MKESEINLLDLYKRMEEIEKFLGLKNEDAEDLYYETFAERLKDIGQKLVYLEQLIEFWNGKVPRKYKKFNPKEGENPFFTCDKFKNNDHLSVGELLISNGMHEMQMPRDPSEYQRAKEDMRSRLELYKADQAKPKPSEPSSIPSQ